MKKIKADALIQKLITNKISRNEFDEFLEGLEDDQMVHYMEKSLKNHFDSIMEEHLSQVEQPDNLPKAE